MSSEIVITLEFTPNPETLKYVANYTLIPSGAANFTDAKAAEGKSLLATELFKFSDVSAVMFGKNFVTLTVKNQDKLMELNEQVIQTIKVFLSSGKPVVSPDFFAASSKSLSDIEQKIISILENEIRPAVAMDGGDISFEKYEDGFVYLKMHGSCSGCPSSMMTLKMGVETRLRDAIPEIQEVIPV